MIDPRIKHIVCFSKGHSSARVAECVVRRFGKENVILLNHNINPSKEKKDIKRFGREVSAYLHLPIIYANYQGVKDENDIPDQFDISIEQSAFKQPNTSNSLCTYHLKTLPFEQFLILNFPHQDCIIYYGFDKTEQSRINRREYVLGMMGYQCDFPLARWEAGSYLESIREIGIEPPLTYSVYSHANCTGCLKGGIQHWYAVYCNDYDVFVKGRTTETILDYTILKRSVRGKAGPVSLIELEPIFERMKCAGVPQTEHYDTELFKKQLKRYNIVSLNLFTPCECVTN